MVQRVDLPLEAKKEGNKTFEISCKLSVRWFANTTNGASSIATLPTHLGPPWHLPVGASPFCIHPHTLPSDYGLGALAKAYERLPMASTQRSRSHKDASMPWNRMLCRITDLLFETTIQHASDIMIMPTSRLPSYDSGDNPIYLPFRPRPPFCFFVPTQL